MIPYILLFVSLIILSLLEFFSKKRIFFIIAMIEIILFAGLRYETGYDYLSYKAFFERVRSFGDILSGGIDAEPGYLLTNYIVKMFGMDFTVFILIYSVVSLTLLGWFVYKNVSYPTMILVYYVSRFYFVRDMGQIRASFVAIIFLYCLPAIKEKNLPKVVLLSLLGSCFHIVALFIIPAYFFVEIIKKLTLQKVMILTIISALIGVLFFFPDLFLWAIPSRYAGYFAGKYVTGEWILNPIFIMQMGITVAAILFVKGKNKEYNDSFNTLLSLYFLSTLFLIIFGPLATVGGRIGTIFATAEILVVPELFRHMFKNQYLNLACYYIFCVLVFFLIFILSNTYQDFIPYQTVYHVL